MPEPVEPEVAAARRAFVPAWLTAARFKGPANLITNPNAQGPSGTTGWSPRTYADDVATNVVTDPSFETGNDAFTYSGGAARLNDPALALAGNWSVAMDANGLAHKDFTGLTAGVVYNISVGLRRSVGASTRARLHVHDTAGAAAVSATATGAGTGEPEPRLAVQFTATATGAARVHFYGDFANDPAQIGMAYFDQLLLSAGTAAYFDGDTRGAAWTGAAHASTSTRSNFTQTLAPDRSFAFRVQRDIDGLGAQGIYIATNPDLAISQGQYLAMAAELRKGPAAGARDASITAHGDVTITITGTALAPLSDAWQRMARPAVQSTGADTVAEIRFNVSAAAEGEEFYIRRVIAAIAATAAEADDAIASYFDGDTPGYAWTGVAHNSTSRRLNTFVSAGDVLDGPTRLVLPELVATGWHDTSAHPERGHFAVVRRDGPLHHLIGEVLRVSARGRSVIVYCMASAAVPHDLSLARRAMMDLSTLARETLDCQIEVLD